MKKLILTIAAIASLVAVSSAQSTYSKGIGVRLGSGYFNFAQVSYKQFISNAGALEFNAGLSPNTHWVGLTAAGAYQHHFPIGNIPGFNWYIGGGLAVTHIIADNGYNYYGGTVVSLFATGGVDYKFKNIPLNLSADYRPTVNLVRPEHWGMGHYGNFSIAARYTF